MKFYEKFFRNKKVTIMGLGLLGRGLGSSQFLAQCGAKLTITDLKNRKQLSSSVGVLKKYKNIRLVLGRHRFEDFRRADFVIKAAGVPLDSPYVAEAKKHEVPVEMDASLFVKCAPRVKIIGITGTRGKTTTTMLIYHILKGNEKFLGRRIYLGGNVRGLATLPLLKKVRAGDIVVLELDSWQLQGFGEAKISPSIAVFTSFMSDHMNYYKNNMNRYFQDKANIFLHQKKGDLLVVRPGVKEFLPRNIKSKLIVVQKERVKNWPFIMKGEYNRENLACAVRVAGALGISRNKIKNAVKTFRGVEGRLQYIKNIRGVKIYNDNNATTPDATIVALETLGDKERKNIILIMGGADKNLDPTRLLRLISQYCKTIIFLPGTGTDKIMQNAKFKIKNYFVKDLKRGIKQAMVSAKKGDIILFSPAFASFGLFANEYERNDKFMKIINGY